jgi:NAD+ synthase (glutamine-hydrolysing)
MRIALAQINTTVGDLKHNHDLIRKNIEQARDLKCDLVVFPEMAVIGYPPKDLLERPSFIAANKQVLDDLVASTKGIYVLCGYVETSAKTRGKPLHNAAALFGEGKILAKTFKRLMPFYDVFDETRYFEPGTEAVVVELLGRRLGLSICEDIWNVPELFPHLLYDVDPIEELVQAKIDILVNISASPYFMRKRVLRESLLRKISKKYGIPAVYVNQVGGNDDLLFDGVSMVFDGQGRLRARAREFESDMVVWDSETDQGEIREIAQDAETSVLEGLIMGVRDYFQKCGFKKALVGLSGGIDSSLVAAIAARALGAENVMGLSMPSRYTSAMSLEDSRLLAKNLGIRFEEIPITPIFDAYLQQLSPLFKGAGEDQTEENIQARIRGNLLMAVSNKFGHLVLSTGNKSEIAVGYCTLYGDMSGGLSVISDVPKTMCYALARCINRERQVIPERVLTRPPSAELKPNQTDQDTLPPYEILDAILHAYVEEHKGLDAIVRMGYDEETVRFVIRRINQNEYKRQQMAPGLKITHKAFGFGRRYPIAKGSYNE